MTLVRFVQWLVVIVVLIAAAVSVWYLTLEQKRPTGVVAPPVTASTTYTTTAVLSYRCDAAKSITVTYREQNTPAAPVAAGEPPVPTGQVVVVFGAEPPVTLAQSLSADGARYANADESLVFWSKGQGAMVLEQGEESTYRNCIAVSAESSVVPEVYHDGVHGFTVRYPADFTVATYTYSGIDAMHIIPGVKFTLSPALATGTNLSRDSYVSIEYQASTTTVCDASSFLSDGRSGTPTVITDGDRSYSYATTADAGAGNRYEEAVYVIPNSQPCIGVRTFTHSTVLENYDPGTVRAFDAEALTTLFTAVRRSLVTDPRFTP